MEELMRWDGRTYLEMGAGKALSVLRFKTDVAVGSHSSPIAMGRARVLSSTREFRLSI